jgi:Acyl-CoA thioesterase C-terminal domain/Acyl-CoA thioesterase N-terminal domain
VSGAHAAQPAAAFAVVSALHEVSPGRFDAEVSPDWTIGGKPNGGYLLSLLGRAAVSTSRRPHVNAASAHYLRAPEPGAATLHAEVLRAGRSTSQVRARLAQAGTVCVEALLSTSDLDAASVVHWDRGLPAPTNTAYEDCVRLEAQAPNGMRVNIMEQIEVRLDPDSRGFAMGRPSGRGELRGWLSLPHGASFDPVSLLFAVDAFPPATFDIAFTGWVPTFQLTVFVRALPAPGPVSVLQRAQLIAGQQFDETCFIWDAHGTLVAHSTQLAGIRFDGNRHSANDINQEPPPDLRSGPRSRSTMGAR